VYDNSKPQWTMTVTIYHGPSFGHAIEVATETKGRPAQSTRDSIGTWRGVGCPEDVYRGALTLINAIFGDHIMFRYGVASELKPWEDVPDPF
jgi:hypothetical protein